MDMDKAKKTLEVLKEINKWQEVIDQLDYLLDGIVDKIVVHSIGIHTFEETTIEEGEFSKEILTQTKKIFVEKLEKAKKVLEEM